MPNLPFTICTKDYAKDATLSEYTYSCETDYPITNANNENRLSYARFNSAALYHGGFDINFGSSTSINLIIIELARPYIFKEINTFYYTGTAAWKELQEYGSYRWYVATDSYYHLPGQVSQYAILKINNIITTEKLRFLFDDENSINQIKLKRVIACKVIDEFNGGGDFYAPAEQSHVNIGKMQIELLHGNKFRAQSFGALKQNKQMRFPQINPEQMKLLEDLESDYAVFGILDWTGRYLEGFIPPGGLTVNDSGVDADGNPWFDVTMKFQEN
jgi:hypothetical protein